MGLTYLQLINRILPRISQAEISSVTGLTGQPLIVSQMINEAQNDLFAEENWHTLFATRLFSTVKYTASTIAFNNADPDTITDSASGFGSFLAGMQIYVSGSTSNDGVYVIATAAAGTLTLQTADALTAEIAGDSVTIYAITYPVATDWGRTIDLSDVTNNTFLVEDYSRNFDMNDPDCNETSNPRYFNMEGRKYRLYPIPNGTYKIRDRYWKIPTALSSTTDTSDLPIECENLILELTSYKIKDYLKNYESADRHRARYTQMLGTAKIANRNIVNRMLRMGGRMDMGNDGIHMPKFPSKYGAGYY